MVPFPWWPTGVSIQGARMDMHGLGRGWVLGNMHGLFMGDVNSTDDAYADTLPMVYTNLHHETHKD